MAGRSISKIPHIACGSRPAQKCRRKIIEGEGLFSRPKAAAGRVIIAFTDRKMRLDEFLSTGKIPSGKVRAELNTARTAFSATRTALAEMVSTQRLTIENEINEALSMMLLDMESNILSIMEKDEICLVSAAKRHLSRYQNLKESADEKQKSVYRQIESALVMVLDREESHSIERLKARINSSPEPVVLVCRDVPDLGGGLLSLPKLAAVIREGGGKTDHHSLVLAEAGKMSIIGIGNATRRLKIGDYAIVDGIAKKIISQPTPFKLSETEKQSTLSAKLKRMLAAERRKPAKTLDGVNCKIGLNVGSVNDLKYFPRGYDGVGLVRTEFTLTSCNGQPRRAAPSVEEQILVYESMIADLHKRAAGRKPEIYFRTLDLDSDKLPYLDLVSLDRDDVKRQGFGMFLNPKNYQLYLLFRSQLEALLLTRGKKHIMFPNVFSLADFTRALEIADEIARWHRGLVQRVEKEATFGIMVENPQVISELEKVPAGELDPRLKFISFGTNDLTCYTLGISRRSTKLSGQLDELHPDVLAQLKRAVTASRRLDLRISLCGNMGNDPLALIVLIGLGIKAVSIDPDLINVGRRIIRSIDAVGAAELIESFKGVVTPEQVRQTARTWVRSKIKDGTWGELKPIESFFV